MKILSTGKFKTSKILTNDDISKFLDTNDEWIKSRTGIERRHIIDDQEFAIKEAVSSALEKLNLTIDDMDLIVSSSSSTNLIFPNISGYVLRMFDAKKSIPVFHIDVACSSYTYGLSMINALMKTNGYKKVIFINAEFLTRSVDWNKRDASILFGDGVAATILENNENLFDSKLGGKVSEEGLLDYTIPANEDNKIGLSEIEGQKIVMNGGKVFKFAVETLCVEIDKIMTKNNLKIEDIKYIIPHSANKRISDFAIKRMKIDPNKFFNNIEEYGNTSGASIGLSINELIEKGKLKSGDKVILIGFGAGLSYGTILMEV